MLKISLLLLSLMAASVWAEVINIDNEALQKLVAQGVPVVDIRTVGEWQQTGVLAGSQMITLYDERGQSNPVSWKQEINAVSKNDAPVVLICRSGNRSAHAAALLNEASPGRRVYNVSGGMVGWIRSGQSVVPFQQNVKAKGVRCAPVC